MAYRQTNPEVIDYNRGGYDTYPNQPRPTPIQGETVTYNQENLRKSDYSRSGKEQRFEDYRKKNGYKYNFFSMIDEPWNRCCEFGNCGQCCPPN